MRRYRPLALSFRLLTAYAIPSVCNVGFRQLNFANLQHANTAAQTPQFICGIRANAHVVKAFIIEEPSGGFLIIPRHFHVLNLLLSPAILLPGLPQQFAIVIMSMRPILDFLQNLFVTGSLQLVQDLQVGHASCLQLVNFHLQFGLEHPAFDSLSFIISSHL